MLDITKLADGYVSLHTKHGGQVFMLKKGKDLFSTNLDGVDPDGFESAIDVDLTGYCLAENISEQRFHWLREQANSRAHINKLTAALQLKQLVQQGEQAGVIQKTGGGDEPVRVEKPSRIVAGPGSTAPVPEKAAAAPTPGPAPIAPKTVDDNPGAPISSPENDDGYKDGAIVDVPAPVRR